MRVREKKSRKKKPKGWDVKKVEKGVKTTEEI